MATPLRTTFEATPQFAQLAAAKMGETSPEVAILVWRLRARKVMRAYGVRD